MSDKQNINTNQEKKVTAEEIKLTATKTKDGIPLLNLSNTDDKKTLMQLMNEGCVLFKDNAGVKIVSEQYNNLYYKAPLPVIHSIYLDDIIGINVKLYYDDLRIQEQYRKLLNVVVWCHHKGYVGWSTISGEQLDMLLKEGYVLKKLVTYTLVDAMRGESFFNTTPNISLQEILDEIKRRKKIEDSNKGSKMFNDTSNSELTIPKIDKSKVNRSIISKKESKVVETPESVTKEIFKDTNVSINTTDKVVNSDEQKTVNVQEQNNNQTTNNNISNIFNNTFGNGFNNNGFGNFGNGFGN